MRYVQYDGSKLEIIFDAIMYAVYDVFYLHVH